MRQQLYSLRLRCAKVFKWNAFVHFIAARRRVRDGAQKINPLKFWIDSNFRYSLEKSQAWIIIIWSPLVHFPRSEVKTLRLWDLKTGFATFLASFFHCGLLRSPNDILKLLMSLFQCASIIFPTASICLRPKTSHRPSTPSASEKST